MLYLRKLPYVLNLHSFELIPHLTSKKRISAYEILKMQKGVITVYKIVYSKLCRRKFLVERRIQDYKSFKRFIIYVRKNVLRVPYGQCIIFFLALRCNIVHMSTRSRFFLVYSGTTHICIRTYEGLSRIIFRLPFIFISV